VDIALVQTNNPNEFDDPELIERSQKSTLSPKTQHYKGISLSKEVAFVSLDRWPEYSEMIVYELFVPRPIRRQGIAAAVLNEVERISACEGFSNVSVIASPLDADITEDALCGWYSRRGYIRDPNMPRKLKLTRFNHWYAHDMFCKAVRILATGREEVRKRLLHVWQDALRGLDDDMLSEDLSVDLQWIGKQLHKFHEEWPGQLDDLKRKEKLDPTFKENYAHLYPNEVEASLARMRKKTGATIALRIHNIYEVLKERKWKSLTLIRPPVDKRHR
jgi:hypothetical protein